MAKKKRVKSGKPSILPIENWEQADKLLAEISNLQLANNKDDESAKEKIDEINAELARNKTARKTSISQRLRSLEAFAANHQDDFDGNRSRRLAYGTVGCRKSTSISISRDTTLDLIKEVFSKVKAKTLITIKESVSKDALARLTDEQLASVNARRKVKDDFFAEPSMPDEVDYQ